MKNILMLFFPLILLAKSGVLINVIDTDMVVFEVKKKAFECQMAYVDSPDILTCSDVKTAEMKLAGREAKAFIEKLMKVGETYAYDVVYTDGDGKPYCEIQLRPHQTMNLTMIKEGYAVPDDQRLPVMYKRKYRPAMNAAKRSSKGLWKSHPQVMECLR